MRLRKVADFFNKTRFLDAYTGEFLAFGQLAPFSDSTRDSLSAERHIGSFSPDFTAPVRGVVEVEGQKFIMGSIRIDVHAGVRMRAQVPMHDAATLVEVLTLDQVCSAVPGNTCWGNAVWIKNDSFSEQSSDMTPQYQVFLAASEPLQEYMVLRLLGEAFVVRSVQVGASGVKSAMAEQMHDGQLSTATLTRSVFDKIAGQATTTTATAQVLHLRWQAIYKYGVKQAPKFGPDDSLFAVSRATGVKPGDVITTTAGAFRVTAIDASHGVDLCRVSESRAG